MNLKCVLQTISINSLFFFLFLFLPTISHSEEAIKYFGSPPSCEMSCHKCAFKEEEDFSVALQFSSYYEGRYQDGKLTSAIFVLTPNNKFDPPRTKSFIRSRMRFDSQERMVLHEGPLDGTDEEYSLRKTNCVNNIEHTLTYNRAGNLLYQGITHHKDGFPSQSFWYDGDGNLTGYYTIYLEGEDWMIKHFSPDHEFLGEEMWLTM